jgi:TfoX/Sxy family transcriptional regulator of competence genes
MINLQMAYNEQLADIIREVIADIPHVEEKHMFGGVCFMVNGKMCVGVVKDEMMCRIDPDIYATLLEKEGCSEMLFTGRPMRGFVYVDERAWNSKKQLKYWIGLCLDYNHKAKATVKKKK